MTSPLGLPRGIVRIHASDPRWPALFSSEADRLNAMIAHRDLGPLALEHVGSTAVPGLAAKPILDLMAGLPPDTDWKPYVSTLLAAGYEARGPQGIAERELFVLGPEESRTHHLHVVEKGSRFWIDHLEFRDRLRGDPELAGSYAKLKYDLAARHIGDREAYTSGKAAFIAAVLSSSDQERTG
jgi:GrpB-like predicted nucleotidyltransferase (UPF0157 family)